MVLVERHQELLLQAPPMADTCNLIYCLFGIADVKEWLHQNHKRFVKVKIGPDESVYTVNRKGETLRKVSFSSVPQLIVQVTSDTTRKPMCLIRSPNDHDLVSTLLSSLLHRKSYELFALTSSISSAFS